MVQDCFGDRPAFSVDKPVAFLGRVDAIHPAFLAAEVCRLALERRRRSLRDNSSEISVWIASARLAAPALLSELGAAERLLQS